MHITNIQILTHLEVQQIFYIEIELEDLGLILFSRTSRKKTSLCGTGGLEMGQGVRERGKSRHLVRPGVEVVHRPGFTNSQVWVF